MPHINPVPFLVPDNPEKYLADVARVLAPIEERFSKGRKLYPHFGELLEVKLLIEQAYVRGRQLLPSQSHDVTGYDAASRSLISVYQTEVGKRMQLLLQLLPDALTLIEAAMKPGRELFETVWSGIEIVQLASGDFATAGLLLVPHRAERAWLPFRYSLTAYQLTDDTEHRLNMQRLPQLPMEGQTEDAESAWYYVANHYREAPRGNVFFVAAPGTEEFTTLPLQETFLPITKRMFLIRAREKPN